MSRFSLFDSSRLDLHPPDEREHDMQLEDVLPLDAPVEPFANPQLPQLVERIVAACAASRPVVMMMGAHVIKWKIMLVRAMADEGESYYFRGDHRVT